MEGRVIYTYVAQFGHPFQKKTTKAKRKEKKNVGESNS
jgi:hypothetical protein